MGFLEKLSKSKELNNIMNPIHDQKPPEFISSGNYALNGIVSGNVHNCIDTDSIVALVGPSNSGKSLFLAHFVKGAQELGHEIVIFDSERAVKKGYYEKIGCDVSKIYRIPVGSIIEFRNKAFDIIEKYYKESDGKGKLFVGLDSLGNLASDKELKDTEADKDNSDQGTNAKFQNSAFRVLSSLACKYNFPCVFTNHVYANPADMFGQRDKIAGGGKAIYNSNTIIYFERMVNKEEVEDEMGKKSKQHVGIKIKATTVKNRVYPEEKTVTMSLRFDSGVNPYSGLLPLALQAGVLENKPRGFLVTETGSTVYEKNLYTKDVFTEGALEKINLFLNQNGYSKLKDVFAPDVAIALGDSEDNAEEN